MKSFLLALSLPTNFAIVPFFERIFSARRNSPFQTSGYFGTAYCGVGFSLVKLMIVLAIVGVIAAYAVPAYQDYLARGRVGEGLALASAAKLAVAENALAGASFESGYVSPASTRNVASIDISPLNGEISILYTPRVAPAGQNRLVLVPSSIANDGGEGGADDAENTGSRVALTPGLPPSSALVWECFASGKTRSAFDETGPTPKTPATLPGRLSTAECRA